MCSRDSMTGDVLRQRGCQVIQALAGPDCVLMRRISDIGRSEIDTETEDFLQRTITPIARYTDLRFERWIRISCLIIIKRDFFFANVTKLLENGLIYQISVTTMGKTPSVTMAICSECDDHAPTMSFRMSVYQCSFCGLGIEKSDQSARWIEVQSLYFSDGSAQGLCAHGACLANALHPSVPFDPDMYAD